MSQSRNHREIRKYFELYGKGYICIICQNLWDKAIIALKRKEKF